MKTTSVMIQSLCVPCYNHCRYCLLSWDGRVEGVPWSRAIHTGQRFLNELRDQGIKCSFSFGYSMEHPDLKDALRILSRLGSPTAHFLQCDGMRMRNEDECHALMEMLKEEGVEQLNFTVYGLKEYHDRFAGRKGDFGLLLRMMKASRVPFTARIPLTRENITQVDALVDLLQSTRCERISLFIPNEEGRGKTLAGIRLRQRDLSVLSPHTRTLLNDRIYRTESEWISDPLQESQRMILVSLRPDNIEEMERRDAMSVVQDIEYLDDLYYRSFPGFKELGKRYGDHCSDSYRDLHQHYIKLYAMEHGIHVYDVTDERYSGSRRF